jgi:putative secretion ATPase (PEP-CTERM system associated)
MYEDHYGFTDRPFQLTPDPRFWYESRTHRTAMAYLGYGLAQGEGFIVVTGEIGSGKTTLVGHLMATLDRDRLNAIRLVSTQVEPEDLLRLVAQGLGHDTDGLAKAQLLDRIERGLRAHAAEGRRTLLIVDEAQNLSLPALEELRMLTNFTSDAESLVQIFLLGQPEFRDRLARSTGLEQLRQRVIATHHLTAMEEEEVPPYMIHRLELVGWHGTPAFSDDAYTALHHFSAGVPRRLNVLVGRVLLHGSIEGLERIDADTIEQVAADMDAERETFETAGETAGASQAEGDAGVRVIHASDPEQAERLVQLEERMDGQEAVVRRVMGMLIDWIDQDEDALSHHRAR